MKSKSDLLSFMQIKFFGIIFGILFLSSCANTENVDTTLPRSTPEAENVSSQSIIDFLNGIEASGQEIHSFMYLRHGRVIAEGWWNPFKPEQKHTLYSTSKSFTSTAIGFAVNEHLLSVDDKLISFFPESLPDTVSENLASMSVKDLLTMSAGQFPEPTFSLILPSKDWVSAFLSAPVPNVPGSTFLYNSSATYMLSAIISKVTGETVLDYLTPRLFEPLNIEGMDWEVDPAGINVGGWGLRLKTEDMAKFGQLYLQKGKWKEEQIIPEEWVEEATTMKIDQAPELSTEEKANSDWQQGYCYKFWRSRHNSYRADGAYGQYILVLPEKDVVIAITASVQDMQKEINLVWNYLLPGMSDSKLDPDNQTYESLAKRIREPQIKAPMAEINPSLEQDISGNTYAFENTNDYEKINLTFGKKLCEVKFTLSDGTVESFNFGLGKWIIGETNKPVPNLLPQPKANLEELLPFKTAGSYRWLTSNTLELTLRYIEGPHVETYTLDFKENGLSMQKTVSPNRNQSPEIKSGKLIKP